jgi:peptidoglycan/LPS O-acetylase OafA/YrhL
VSLEAWLTLPTPEWAGNLVGLALAIVSAGAALYASLIVPWAAELGTATDATNDANGQLLNPRTTDGARALGRLSEIRRRDPRNGVGLVALGVALPMTLLGIVAGLQIPNVGWLFTIVPVVISAIVAALAGLVPGRSERKDADERLREMGVRRS